jgi:dihydroorotate dehydrogenase (NAD+) catalytic subunit
MPVSTPFYDPTKTFDDNFDHGPFPTAEGHEAEQGEPQSSFLGKPVYAPFGIPAGPLPTSKHVAFAFEQGFDIICYKTQRSVPFACNEFPNVVYLDVVGDLTLEKAAQPIIGLTHSTLPKEKLTITNSFGNPSRGPDFWVEDMKRAVVARGKGQLLIASVVGTIQDGFSAQDYYEDFAHCAELAASTGVDAIELNLSCPNVASEGVICYTKEAVTAICKATKAHIGDVPLIAKIGYFDDTQTDLLEQIIIENAAYLAAISAINTIAAPVVTPDGEQMLPGEGRLKSGCCGAGIKWAGISMVTRLDAIRKKTGLQYEIIGVGGVMTPKDFEDYRAAGADAVQSATGAMWNQSLAHEIKAHAIS